MLDKISFHKHFENHHHPFAGIEPIRLWYTCVNYLRSLMVKAVHQHPNGVDSIPAAGPILNEFFQTVPGLNFDMSMISTRD